MFDYIQNTIKKGHRGSRNLSSESQEDTQIEENDKNEVNNDDLNVLEND